MPVATKVIAHRGASRDYPENTCAAFDEALRQGADGIELDVQLSRDGIPVLWHDRTLARAGDGLRRVRALDLDAIERLDAAARWPRAIGRHAIPTLDEVLAGYARRTLLLVEIKLRDGAADHPRHRLLARAVAASIRQARAEARVVVLCFDQGVLDEVRAAGPRIRCALNLKPPPRLGPALAGRLAGLDGVSADVRRLTPAFGAAVRDMGLPLYVFTCNTPAAVRRALAAGAAGVMADRPAWLAAQLRRARESGR